MIEIKRKEVGNRLRKLRGDRSQKAVADALGLSAMAISQYESGKRIPTDNIKLSFAHYYGKSVDEIFFAP